MLIKVEGISSHIGKEELNDLFSKMGQVESVTIIRDIYTGKSKEFGFVAMSDLAEGGRSTRFAFLEGSLFSFWLPDSK